MNTDTVKISSNEKSYKGTKLHWTKENKTKSSISTIDLSKQYRPRSKEQWSSLSRLYTNCQVLIFAS